MNRLVNFLVLGLFMALTVSLVSCSAPATPVEQVGEISWEETKDNVDKTLTVCGPIVTGTILGEDTYVLSMGKSIFEGGFAVSIAVTDAPKFPEGDPIKAYVDKTICVTGKIYANEYGGISITPTDPSQITVK